SLLLEQRPAELERLRRRQSQQGIFAQGRLAADGWEQEQEQADDTDHGFFSDGRSRHKASRSATRAAGSGAPKSAEPTTARSIPAAAARGRVSRSRPPSISMSNARPRLRRSATSRRTFSRV